MPPHAIYTRHVAISLHGRRPRKLLLIPVVQLSNTREKSEVEEIPLEDLSHISNSVSEGYPAAVSMVRLSNAGEESKAEEISLEDFSPTSNEDEDYQEDVSRHKTGLQQRQGEPKQTNLQTPNEDHTLYFPKSAKMGRKGRLKWTNEVAREHPEYHIRYVETGNDSAYVGVQGQEAVKFLTETGYKGTRLLSTGARIMTEVVSHLPEFTDLWSSIYSGRFKGQQQRQRTTRRKVKPEDVTSPYREFVCTGLPVQADLSLLYSYIDRSKIHGMYRMRTKETYNTRVRILWNTEDEDPPGCISLEEIAGCTLYLHEVRSSTPQRYGRQSTGRIAGVYCPKESAHGEENANSENPPEITPTQQEEVRPNWFSVPQHPSPSENVK